MNETYAASQYAKNMRKKHYHLDSAWTISNHTFRHIALASFITAILWFIIGGFLFALYHQTGFHQVLFLSLVFALSIAVITPITMGIIFYIRTKIGDFNLIPIFNPETDYSKQTYIMEAMEEDLEP